MDTGTCMGRPKSCPAGQYNSDRGITENSCVLCSANQYSGFGSSSCSNCPNGGTSSAGATDVSECAAAVYSCSQNSYNSDSGSTLSSCRSCPSGSTSNAGSTSVSQCRCPANKYLSSGVCKPCPNSGTSYEGSTSVTDCTGAAAFTCPANQYNYIGGFTSSSCFNCPSGTTSPSGSTSFSQCTGGGSGSTPSGAIGSISSTTMSCSNSDNLGGNSCLYSSILSAYLKGLTCSSGVVTFAVYSDDQCSSTSGTEPYTMSVGFIYPFPGRSNTYVAGTTCASFDSTWLRLYGGSGCAPAGGGGGGGSGGGAGYAGTVCATQASATRALLASGAAEPTSVISCYDGMSMATAPYSSAAWPMSGDFKVCGVVTVAMPATGGGPSRMYRGARSLAAAYAELANIPYALSDLIMCTSANCNNPASDACGTANGAAPSLSSPVCGGAPAGGLPAPASSSIACHINWGETARLQPSPLPGSFYCVSATHTCSASDPVPNCRGLAEGSPVRLYFDQASAETYLQDAVFTLEEYIQIAYSGGVAAAQNTYRTTLDAFTVCNTAGCNDPSSDSCALATTPVVASFTLSSLPASSLANGVLTPAAVTVLTTALSAAVRSYCSSCTASISRVVDASGAVLYSGARRLQTSALTVTFSLIGGSPATLQAVAAGAGASGSGFLATLAAQIVAAGGSGYASVTVAPPAAPAAAGSDSAAPIGGIIGGVVGGLVVLGGIAAAVYFLCIRKAAGAVATGAAAAAGAAAAGMPPGPTVLVLRGAADPVNKASV